MGSRFQTSTGKLMLLVAVVALEMWLLTEVWEVLEIVLFPPFTMICLALNLGVFFLAVRPLAMETRILGMIWGGVAASCAMALTLGTYVPGPRGPGPLGRLMEGALTSWEISLDNQNGAEATVVHWLRTRVIGLEYALLDALAVIMIWSAGRVEAWLRARRTRARAAGPPSLDDRAATPL
jgi:hypothetical protein